MNIPKPNIKYFDEQFEKFKNKVFKSLEETVWSSPDDPPILKKIPDIFYSQRYGMVTDMSLELESLFRLLNKDNWTAKMTRFSDTEGYFIQIYPRGINEEGYFRKPSAG